MTKKIPVALIMGPTASGKTALAEALCDEMPCEIINVDSAQFYKGLDIGSAKPCQKELDEYPHRMLSFLEPHEHYSVGRFVEDVHVEISDIVSKGKLPLLVGGSMLYFKALVEGLNDMPQSDMVLRQRLERVVNRKGVNYAFRWLSKIDPITAERLHNNDTQRILRALEVFILSGNTLSSMHEQAIEKPQHNYQWLPVILFPQNRAALHTKIAERVDHMIHRGFVKEVEALYSRGDLTLESTPCIRAVGYRQIWLYLEAFISYENMKAHVIIATRQFAKRQFTWLRGLSGQLKPLLVLDSSDVLVAKNKQKQKESKNILRDQTIIFLQKHTEK